MTTIQAAAPPPETGAATTPKPGWGGKRPGAGRQAPEIPGRKYGISLPGAEARRLEAAAAAEGIRPGAWIRRAVLRALEALR